MKCSINKLTTIHHGPRVSVEAANKHQILVLSVLFQFFSLFSSTNIILAIGLGKRTTSVTVGLVTERPFDL